MAGHIVAVVGGKGGVGKSIVAANYAVAFSQEKKLKPLLIDLDLNSLGDQNLIHGQTPSKTIAGLTANLAGAIDPKTLAPYLIQLPYGIHFISAPLDQTSAQSFHIENYGRLLKGLTSIFPLIVVDCGHTLDPSTLKTFEHATLILVVTGADLISLNQTKRLLRSISELFYPQEMVHVILNKSSTNSIINPTIAEKSISKTIFNVIPEDAASFEQSLAKGVPISSSLPQSNAARAFRELIRKIDQFKVLEKAEQIKKNTKSKQASSPNAKSTDPKNAAIPSNVSDRWTFLKLRIHKELIDKMDLKKMSSDTSDQNKKTQMREQTQKAIVEILETLDTDNFLQTRDMKSQIIKEVLDEALGLGPLEDLLSDDTVTEIMVNAKDQIYIEKNGKPQMSTTTFSSELQMMNVIERIVTPLGRRVDEKVPYVDARLTDGSRVHVIIPPLALKGPTITIRKFPKKRMSYKSLVEYGSLTEEMADFLRVCVEGKLNVVVSGGTGSGKTTLLNVLSNFIPSTERIITVEDSAELQLGQEHVVRLESRPKNIEGEGEVSIRELIKCCLRMRPDRIVVGECRGGEALDMLQAMNTGHSGSLTTLHSNNPRECIGRLETLVMMSGLNLPIKAIRENIASAVGLIIQQSRLSDGSRKITHVTEVIGIQGDTVVLQDIFLFTQEGIDKKRKVVGKFGATGFVPTFIEDMEAKGLKISRGLFNQK